MAPNKDVESGLRLPSTVVCVLRHRRTGAEMGRPSHYDLTTKIDLEKLTFSGTVSIQLDVHEATDTIVLHCAPQLTVSSAAIATSQLKTDSKLEAERIEKPDAKTELLKLVFPSGSIANGKAVLGLTFSGELEGSMMVRRRIAAALRRAGPVQVDLRA